MRNERGIRRELPYFLGTPNDWRGCFIPLEPSQVGMFQICYKPGMRERLHDFFTLAWPRRSLEGVNVSSANLLHYVDQDVRTRLQHCVAIEQPNSVRLLSQCKRKCVHLKALVNGLNLESELEGGERKSVDLRATVRRIEQVPVHQYSVIDDALRQVAPRICKDIARITNGNRPAYLYVIVGTMGVDLHATASANGRPMVDVPIAKDRIALVCLLKYRILQEPPKGAAVASRSSDTVGSWTIGKRVPLDDVDTTTTGLS